MKRFAFYLGCAFGVMLAVGTKLQMELEFLRDRTKAKRVADKVISDAKRSAQREFD